MPLFSINLLPPEFISEQVKKTKFVKVQSISIAVLLLTFFIASLTISLRVLQTQNFNQIKKKLDQVEVDVNNFKGAEGSLLTIKERLGIIEKSIASSSQALLFDFIQKVVPQNISISSISIDKGGEIFLSLLSPDISTLDNMISNIYAQSNEEIRIKQIAVEGLSRTGEGSYKLSLRLKSSK